MDVRVNVSLVIWWVPVVQIASDCKAFGTNHSRCEYTAQIRLDNANQTHACCVHIKTDYLLRAISEMA